MNTVKFKYIFTFYKKGYLIFIGHLDLMRLFERAFQKSGLPLLYSQGFNPHLRLSLPFPLSVGVEGRAEYGEIYLTKLVTDLMIVNKYLPEDIQLTGAKHSADDRSLTNKLKAFEYTVDRVEKITIPNEPAGMKKLKDLVDLTKVQDVVRDRVVLA